MGGAASVGMSAFSATYGAASAKSQGKYNSKVMYYNAQISQQKSAMAIAQGREEELKFRWGVNTFKGKQRASFAGAGVNVNKGSALELQLQSTYMGELDALTIRNNAKLAAWGYEIEAWNSIVKADMIKREASAKATQSILKGISSIGGSFGGMSFGGGGIADMGTGGVNPGGLDGSAGDAGGGGWL